MGRPKGTKNISLHMWTNEEKKYLEEITPGHHYLEIQELMNKKFNLDFTFNQIKAAIGRYNLNTGFNGQFQKGSTPANKGTKGLTSANRTSFYKGQPPTNYKPIGSERITKDGYIQIKIKDPNKWELKHRVIWEKENGPLPRGHAIIFADGNKLNLDINNFILVTRAQLLIMNTKNLKKNDRELTKVGVNIARVYERIAERKKGNEDRR